MLRIMVLCLFTLSKSVSAGYDYPKPIVPFELPNSQPNLQDIGGQIVQDISTQSDQKMSHPVPYGDYFYSKLYVNNGSGNNVVQSPGDTINSEHQNLKISTLQGLNSLTPITTELNANIDASLSIQSPVLHSPIVSESKSIYEPTYSLTSHKTVPLINLQTTESQTFNSENVHNVDSNLLSLSYNIPVTFNVENSNPNLLSTQNGAASELHLHDDVASYVQNNALPTPNGQNVLPMFNVRHSYRINVEKNEQSSNASNGLIGNIPPVQEVGPKLYTPSYNTQNSFSDNMNDKRNHFYSNTLKEESQLLETQNNPALVHQSQFDSIHSSANPIESKQDYPTPVVTKHVYFHVPPPDNEEVPVAQERPTPKKIYKIIFITLPAHESKNKELQAALYNNNNLVSYNNEDKTLIYVLVNNSEPAQVVLPQPKRSEHQVLFVKYRDNPSTTPEEESPFIETNSNES